MNTSSPQTCKVIRSTVNHQGKQGPNYAGAICADRVGSPGLWFGTVILTPELRPKRTITKHMRRRCTGPSRYMFRIGIARA